LWETIAAGAEAESSLWRSALRPAGERELEPVFSPLAAERYAVGLETIYEGYLVHYGRPRIFRELAPDEALLLGDYLYAHGLVRVASLGEVAVVAALAELIARCAHLRAEVRPGDGMAWAETVQSFPGGGADVARALAAHARRVG
jgi:hypothetical protein